MRSGMFPLTPEGDWTAAVWVWVVLGTESGKWADEQSSQAVSGSELMTSQRSMNTRLDRHTYMLWSCVFYRLLTLSCFFSKHVSPELWLNSDSACLLFASKHNCGGKLSTLKELNCFTWLLVTGIFTCEKWSKMQYINPSFLYCRISSCRWLSIN